MVVNGNAFYQDKRGVLESIASRLAPTWDGRAYFEVNTE